ncbi:MAG TPA: flagellar biosynthesis protein FlgB [Kineosporiaceae bacterium]|jgi:flagellar basal-body rod protein FlgB|nr:flagellar biosynthesis protein FlgB [Kineosporiaceae bacterium]
MLDDVSVDALHAAMRGLAARQRAISDDIANVDTPFYRARNVSFEGDLKRALDGGRDPMSVAPTTVVSTAPGGLNGNNVDLTAETTASVSTELAYQLALRAAGDRFGLYRAAIRGA